MLRRITLLTCLLLLSNPAAAETLQMKDCRISAGPGSPSMKARCGHLTRPLDPSGEVDGEIELRVAVVPALTLTPESDPLLPIAGGPGQGSVEFYTHYSFAFEPTRRTRDILLIDQRGTGESARMDCPVDDDIIEGQYTTEQTLQFANDCIAQLPHDPRFFTTSVAVTDIEAVRVALGYQAVNLYGVSYGSRVAQHFARRYPESTRSVVIDGVVPPQKSLGPEIATESQKAVENIIARCTENAACGERFPDLQQQFDAVVERLRNAAVDIDVPHPSSGRPEKLVFGESEFAAAIRLLVYHPNSIALLPLMVSEAAAGNFLPIGSQFAMTMISMTDSMALGMHNAIMCTEDIPFYDKTLFDYEALDASYMGRYQIDALETICSVWPQGPIDDDFKTPLASDIPVLLLSGDADPITPPRYAELALLELSNQSHLVGEHQGHGQLFVGCTPRLIGDFVATADPASLDSECMERSFVMPFFLDFSGPSP